MPQTLINRIIDKTNKRKASHVHITSDPFKAHLSLGKTFFRALILPKYGVLNTETDRTIPKTSFLAEKIQQAFLKEVANHPNHYPQNTDAKKYQTELKFQILANEIAHFLSERPHVPYSYYRNHFSPMHQAGMLVSIGNGDFKIPVLDNMVHYLSKSGTFEGMQVPEYKQNGKIFDVFLHDIFNRIRGLPLRSLEEKYEKCQKRLLNHLRDGKGAVVSDDVRDFLNFGDNPNPRISDYIDPTKINDSIREDLRDLTSKARIIYYNKPKNSLFPEASTAPRTTTNIIQNSSFPSIQDIQACFPYLKREESLKEAANEMPLDAQNEKSELRKTIKPVARKLSMIQEEEIGHSL